MLLLESNSSKKSICLTQDREGRLGFFWGGGYSYIDDGCMQPPPPPLHAPCCHAGRSLSLSRGVDVQLTLQDVVDDGLTQVVHNVAVTVLQGQSDGGGGALIQFEYFTFNLLNSSSLFMRQEIPCCQLCGSGNAFFSANPKGPSGTRNPSKSPTLDKHGSSI